MDFICDICVVQKSYKLATSRNTAGIAAWFLPRIRVHSETFSPASVMRIFKVREKRRLRKSERKRTKEERKNEQMSMILWLRVSVKQFHLKNIVEINITTE